MRFRSVAFVCAFFAAGCTSPNIFKESIVAFDKSVGEVRGTVEQYATANSVSALDATTASLVEDTRRINFNPGACAVGIPIDRCAVSIVGTDQRLVGPARIEAFKLVDGIKAYTAGLVTVVTATTGDELGKGIDDLSGAIKKLATDLGEGDGSQFLTAIGPITTIVKIIAVNLIEERRREILRMAAADANPVIQRAAQRLARLVGEQQRAEIKLHATLVATRTKQYNVLSNALATVPAPDTARREAIVLDKTYALDGALTGSANLRKLAATDVRTAILAMGTAHTELTKAMNQPEFSVDALYNSLKKFADDAKAAYDAIQKIR